MILILKPVCAAATEQYHDYTVNFVHNEPEDKCV